jgi:hypothetical protein
VAGAEVVEGRGPAKGNTASETRPGRSAGMGVSRYGPIGVVDDSARDAAQQHVGQSASSARAEDDGARVVFGFGARSRIAPDVPGA